jgi:hypothetical protein
MDLSLYLIAGALAASYNMADFGFPVSSDFFYRSIRPWRGNEW